MACAGNGTPRPGNPVLEQPLEIIEFVEFVMDIPEIVVVPIVLFVRIQLLHQPLQLIVPVLELVERFTCPREAEVCLGIPTDGGIPPPAGVTPLARLVRGIGDLMAIGTPVTIPIEIVVTDTPLPVLRLVFQSPDRTLPRDVATALRWHDFHLRVVGQVSLHLLLGIPEILLGQLILRIQPPTEFFRTHVVALLDALDDDLVRRIPLAVAEAEHLEDRHPQTANELSTGRQRQLAVVRVVTVVHFDLAFVITVVIRIGVTLLYTFFDTVTDIVDVDPVVVATRFPAAIIEAVPSRLIPVVFTTSGEFPAENDVFDLVAETHHRDTSHRLLLVRFCALEFERGLLFNFKELKNS